MDSFLERLRSKLRRHGDAPLGVRLAKGIRWARESLSARVWLRPCDQVGSDARILARPRIDNRGRMAIGHAFRLISTWVPAELSTGPEGTLEIGDGVFLNYGTMVSAQGSVRIGNRVMVGNYSIISDTELPGTSGAGAPDLAARPIEIGDDVWLAARVTVLPGARIGAGSIIGAGSVVAGEIPAHVVAGGIPARVLRELRPAPAAPAALQAPAEPVP